MIFSLAIWYLINESIQNRWSNINISIKSFTKSLRKTKLPTNTFPKTVEVKKTFWILKIAKLIHSCLIVEVDSWSWALHHTKISVYFSIRTYFFYFTYSLFKTVHIILSILDYISLKNQIFLIFKFVFLSSYTTTTIHSLS